MKKIIVLLASVCVLLLWTSIFFGIKYNQKKHWEETMAKVSMLLMESYANAVDYTLCFADYLNNRTSEYVCQPYLERFADDTQIFREDFNMETNYRYIGE